MIFHGMFTCFFVGVCLATVVSDLDSAVISVRKVGE
ncbi:hypothetical protein HNQ94_000381 [Salirhabdus euzebyi]|uniref:Uncharacterized protein n=1 Tax=Salirhabdus euzebyi TaxID=394506 RepID=A0A841PT42_9BACI|nr:hypothetical protein [Salirhabdus euzebyi]